MDTSDHNQPSGNNFLTITSVGDDVDDDAAIGLTGLEILSAKPPIDLKPPFPNAVSEWLLTRSSEHYSDWKDDNSLTHSTSISKATPRGERLNTPSE